MKQLKNWEKKCCCHGSADPVSCLWCFSSLENFRTPSKAQVQCPIISDPHSENNRGCIHIPACFQLFQFLLVEQHSCRFRMSFLVAVTLDHLRDRLRLSFSWVLGLSRYLRIIVGIRASLLSAVLNRLFCLPP